MLFDIDNFKVINDSYGHQVGDAVLCEFTRRLRSSLRADDEAGRWGGEEFLVILPQTDVTGALLLGERIRDVISASPVVIGGEPVALTVSGGLATGRDESPDDLIRAADAALYWAKRAGRNRIARQCVGSCGSPARWPWP